MKEKTSKRGVVQPAPDVWSLPKFPKELAVRAELSSKTFKIGEVVSTKMAKTIVVEVSRRVPHPIYKRVVTKRKKFYAHDEAEEARNGDIVRIIESRPLSKLKRWTLTEVLQRAVELPASEE